MADLNLYNEERIVLYKGEKYSVRDNGAIYRHTKDNCKKRPNDEMWTFGKKDESNGYMMFCGNRIHIVVATAFYGEKDSKIYVVDHIDTNRCNNRKENLRWLTRLENALCNPITLNRILYVCGGDINKFLDNPSCLREYASQNKDFGWMCTVSAEEARNAYNNMIELASKKSLAQKTTKTNNDKSCLFKKTNITVQNPRQMFIKAEYPENALQMNWKTPTRFELCPLTTNKNPLQEYKEKLIIKSVFSSNKYSKSIVLDSAIDEEKNKLYVLTKDANENAMKKYGVATIKSIDSQYIHSGSLLFSEEDAKEYFTYLSLGEKGPKPKCYAYL